MTCLDNKLRSRNHWLDYLKAFAMYLVIVGHTMNNCMTGGAETRINGIVYFIHIPLFLVISGLLVKDKVIDKTFGMNLLRRFIVPYTVWTLILTTFYLGKTHLLNDGISANIEVYAANWCHSFLWFIKAYLVVYVLWQLLQKFPCLWRTVVGSVVLVAINMLVIGNKHFSELASLSLYSYTLFGFGACLCRYMNRFGIWWLVAFLLVFMACLPFATHKNDYFECSFNHMLCHGDWHVFFIRLLAGVCISVALIRIGDIWGTKFTPPACILQTLGQQTLQIYMLQSLVVEAMLNRFFNVENSFVGIMEVFIVAAFLTMLCSFVVTKTSTIKAFDALLWGHNKR